MEGDLADEIESKLYLPDSPTNEKVKRQRKPNAKKSETKNKQS